MARAKSLNTYPAGLWTIVQNCAVEKKVFELEVESATQALSLQGQFYAFRGALRRAYDKLKIKPDMEDVAYQQKIRATIEFAEMTVCWVDRKSQPGTPVKVRFMHRDDTPSSKLIQNFLKTGKGASEVISEDILKSQTELLKKLMGTPIPEKPDDTPDSND